MTTPALAYLDASAFIKLVAAEPESAALEAELRRWPQAVASELLEIEARRFAVRFGLAMRPIEAALKRVTLVPSHSQIRNLASTVKPAGLRTLDAVHLATALVLRGRVAAFFAYDQRLAHAARANGLNVVAPS